MFLHFALRARGPRVHAAREGILVVGKDPFQPEKLGAIVRAEPPEAARGLLRRHLDGGLYRVLAPFSYRDALLPVLDLEGEEVLQIWVAGARVPPPPPGEYAIWHDRGIWGLRLRVRGEEVAEATVNWEGRRFAELGVATLGERYEGRGYATAVVRALARMLQRRGRTPLYCAPDMHPASLRVAEKAGFRPSGKREICLEGYLR